jgi:hypothetical protein
MRLNPALLPANASLIGKNLNALASAREEVSREERRQALMETHGNEEKARAFAALRKEVLSISMLPELVANEIFELRPLAKDERILLQTTKRGSYSVRVVDHHGGVPKDEWIFPDTQATYDVYKISTDEVFYPVDSLVQGNLDASDRVNEDLAFDYQNKIDTDVWTLWLSIFDTFPAGTYDRHSRINSSNVPSTNVITATSEGAITVNVMKSLLAHMLLIGRRIRTIYVSPQDMPDIWDWTPVNVSSGADKSAHVINDSLHENIQTSGVVNQMFGYSINWKPLNILATGTMYVTTDMPSGILYYKPDFEMSDMYTQKECRAIFKRPNFEAVYMEGAIKPLVPAPYRMNSVKVVFSS